MKCPLSIVALTVDSFPPDNIYRDCIQEECAWWHKENERCAIITMSQGSVYIHKALNELSSKIPLGILR